MIYAFACLLLGIVVCFVPDEFRLPIMLATLACGFLYVRAMNRRHDDPR